MTTPPFILHILVADGYLDGLRIVERSNWACKTVAFDSCIFEER
jgi:hypothetical protein